MQVALKPAHRYQAPKESGSSLVAPPLTSAIESRSNWLSRQASDSTIEFCGLSLESMRREARLEAIKLAQDYSREYRDIQTISTDVAEKAPLLLAGHQPELFHPGVWFKSFLLAESVKRLGCVALNFLVDNDLCRKTAVKVPSIDHVKTSSKEPVRGLASLDGAIHEIVDAGQAVRLETIAWDSARDAIPWECRLLNDEEVFHSFPKRVREALLPEIERPIVDRLWLHARQAIQRTRIVGSALAQARHALEGELGMQTLEIPLSQLTSTRCFARFSLQLLSELPRFQQIYNSQRDNYRKANRIRSEAHPVPSLQQRHGWLEAPWWVYREEAPKRQRLFARCQDDFLLLADQCGWQSTIEGPLDSEAAVDQWMDILVDDTYLRPRALLTTMFTRMIVGDLFVHGIGGGIYDELTDAILTEFFGCDPPAIVVASATMHLPVAATASTDEDFREAREHSWQLKFHADKFIDLRQAESAKLLEKKQFLITHVPPKGQKSKWHREITFVNQRLSELASAQTALVNKHIETLSDQVRVRRILESREMSFCLFPLGWLDGHLKNLATVGLG